VVGEWFACAATRAIDAVRRAIQDQNLAAVLSDEVEILDLVATRKSLGLTQTEMATRMGLTLNPYQALEMHPDRLRRRHNMLAEYVALEEAVERGI
jgi:DNA-binding XRE family transcriptional regulator